MPADLELSYRHEAFCRYVARGASAAAAARAAGYSPGSARQQAHRLLARPEIRRRIWLLRWDREQFLFSDQSEMIAAAQEMRQAAREAGEFAAAARFLEIELRLRGLFPAQPAADRIGDAPPDMSAGLPEDEETDAVLEEVAAGPAASHFVAGRHHGGADSADEA